MTLTRITLTLIVVLAGASLAFADGGHPKRSSHEVWTVDQSNSAGNALRVRDLSPRWGG
jgi:hypothetical protein